MENPKLVFNDDQKAVINRELNSAYGAMSTLLEWAKTDKLTEEMKETLPSLVDSAMNIVKQTIGFTGEKSERAKELEENIGQYYQKQIKDLEQALSEQGSLGSIPANTKLLFDKIDKWWDIDGFHYTSDKHIAESGAIRIKFGFMLHSYTNRYSDTPVSDNNQLKTKVEYLKENGFQFTPRKNGYDLDLVDTEGNRSRLTELLTNAFPSAKIWSFENRLRPNNNDDPEPFIIRSLDVTIFDVADVEHLVIEDKQFLPDEDEL